MAGGVLLQVELLLESLEGSPKPEEERFMRLACCVMDANAFRMTLPSARTWGSGAGAGRGPEQDALPSEVSESGGQG